MKRLCKGLIAFMCMVCVHGLTAPDTFFPRNTSLYSSHAWSATPQAANLAGHTYYVDVSGDDGGDGSIGQPWKTVNRAVSQVGPGDTVLINPGTYFITQQISIATSGEPGNPITFSGNGQGVFIDLSGYSGRNGFEIYFADYITVENLMVRASQEASSRGIRLTHSNGSIIRNNTVYGAGHANLFCSLSDYVIFENNEAYDGAIGIYVADSTDYATVRSNVLHDNSAIGLHMNGDLSSGGDGTISYAMVDSNRVYNNDATGINLDGVTWSTFRNNLIYNNGKRGIAFFKGNGAVPSNDNEAYQNTIIMPNGGYYAIGLNYGANRNSFYNNIIFTEGNVPCFSSTSSVNELDITSDYNLLSTHSNIGETSNGTFSFQEWQNLGYSGHSGQATMDETFENSTQNNYRLKAGSPAVDAGTPSHSCPLDIVGNVRPYGIAPDIGAYELSGVIVVYISPDGSCDNHTPCYSRIQEGIDWGSNTFIIRVEQGSYDEDIVLNKAMEVNLECGWDNTFTTQLSTSRVNSLKNEKGTLIVDRLVIQ